MDEYEIVELVKDRYRTGLIKSYHNFLLNDRTILSYDSYESSYEHNPSVSKQVIGYVHNDITRFVTHLEFPMFIDRDLIPYAYLYKKGYVIRGISPFGPAPLPNLKYIIHCIASVTGFPGITEQEFKDRLVIELVDLDVVANNLNLPKIMVSVMGPKLLSENNMIQVDERDEIVDRMSSQKLFAGHTWKDAYNILSECFGESECELSKEVLKISEAYQQVFRPYRVVYNTKTWQPVLV